MKNQNQKNKEKYINYFNDPNKDTFQNELDKEDPQKEENNNIRYNNDIESRK